MSSLKSELSSKEQIAKQEHVRRIFSDAIDELGASKIVHFAGFIDEDTNTRAIQNGQEIYYNEKFLSLSKDEVQRWGWHETQHALTRKEAALAEEPRLLYSFVLHPLLRDLHKRMLLHYESYPDYPFYREIKSFPGSYSEVFNANEDYFHPEEILALLKGYQCYLKQQHEGKSPKTDPAEFIEAFRPEDLELLEPAYRRNLANSLLENNLSSLEPASFEIEFD